MKNSRRARSRAGVTLIEVLIAVTLLSLLSIAMLYALRAGLMSYAKTNANLMENRKVAGAQRIIEQELEGIVPVVSPCLGMPQAGGQKFAFFQGEAQTMRIVSTFSLQQAWRGRPQVLEFFVIPGEDGVGVRLLVNELPFGGPVPAGGLCESMAVNPLTGRTMPHFAPVSPSPGSFVLADKLAFCRFVYQWPPPEGAAAAQQPQQNPQQPQPVWSPTSLIPGWPLAIRIEMAPLQADPAHLQPITITAGIRFRRSQEIDYVDF